MAAGSLLAAIFANTKGREGWAFIGTAVTAATAVATYFLALYPDVMPSTLEGGRSLTIENASSSDYTLQVMSWVALVMVPLVLLYQGWTYWVFRKRVTRSHIEKAAATVAS